MKKFFSILAVGAIVSLAACNSNTTSTETTDSTANVTATDSVKPAPVVADTTQTTTVDTTKH